MNRAARALAVTAINVAGFTTTLHPQTFKSSTAIVLVTAGVLKDGRPVAGLTSKDFSITDNGVPQEVSLIAADRMPMDVTIVLGGGDKDLLLEATSSASGFRSRLNATDRVRVISTGERVIELEAMAPSAAPPRYELAGAHGSSFNDGLFYAMAWPQASDRRHLVIAYSVGFDGWSALDTDMLPKLARHTDAVVNIVSEEPPSLAVNASLGGRIAANGWERESGLLFKTARQTGGSVTGIDRAGKTFEKILDGFRASYLLQFTPKGVSEKGWHALDVTVPSMRGVTVKARQGYER